eukprot:COSAG02_NODE_7174_length_3137_cov_20.762673_1_plen_42_part_00
MTLDPAGLGEEAGEAAMEEEVSVCGRPNRLGRGRQRRAFRI